MMKKFFNIDIIKFLKDVVLINTSAYKSDFTYDMQMFYKALREPDDGLNRYFIWLSRNCGTECERMSDILNADRTSKMFYYRATEMSGLMYFLIRLEEIKDNTIIGSVIPFSIGFASLGDEINRNRYIPDRYKVSYLDVKGKKGEHYFESKDYNHIYADAKSFGWKVLSVTPETDDERKEYSEAWAKTMLKEQFGKMNESNVLTVNKEFQEMFSHLSEREPSVKTLRLETKRSKNIAVRKSFVFVYDASFCVDKDMAIRNLQQVVKEYLVSDEGMSHYGEIPEISKDWELPDKFDWVEVAGSMPQRFLAKYGIVRSNEDFYEIV